MKENNISNTSNANRTIEESNTLEDNSTNKEKIGYSDILKQKEYVKLLLANLINRFGDSIDAIAFTWLVYTVTKNPTWSAIVFGVNFIPTILLQPFTGALVENMNKKKVMAFCDIARGGCVAVITLLYITNNLNAYAILLFTIANSSFEAFRLPAGMSITPQLIDKKYYDHAMSLNSSSSRTMELIGTGMAGGIIGIMGIEMAMLIDIATFLLSAICIMWIKTPEIKKAKIKLDIRGYFDTLKEGVIYVKNNNFILSACVLCLLLNGVLVPLNSLLTPYISEVLKQDAFFLSLFSLALTIGTIIGSLLYPIISKRLSSKTIVISEGILLGIFYFYLVGGKYLTDHVIGLGVYLCSATFIVGLAVAQISTLLQVSFVTKVEENYLARAGAIFNASATAAIPIFSMIVALFSKFVSINQVFIASAIITILLFIVVGIKSKGFE